MLPMSTVVCSEKRENCKDQMKQREKHEGNRSRV